MPTLTLELEQPIDLRRSLKIHIRGPGDPTWCNAGGRLVRATRTAEGLATLALETDGRRVRAETWGPGADAALAGVPDLIGLHDDPRALRPLHPIVAELARRLPGLRIGRTSNVVEALVPAILEQKVTGTEAFRAFRGLVRTYGEPAPGPFPLWVAPPAATIAALPYHAFHPLGVERRRADTIRRAMARADRLQEVVALPLDAAYRRLTAIAGIGPWTAAEVALRALGDIDAVSVGDFHLPSLVSWALAGEPRGDDARMLELLEPYRGQRGRVVRLLEASAAYPPRRGPRMAPRSIAGI